MADGNELQRGQWIENHGRYFTRGVILKRSDAGGAVVSLLGLRDGAQPTRVVYEVAYVEPRTSARVDSHVSAAIFHGPAPWRICGEEPATEEGLTAILADVAEAKREQEQAAAEVKRIDAEEREQTRTAPEYKHLEKAADSKKSGHALGAANIRRELKRTWPAVKFKVRSESYTGGSSINVDWTDGPTDKQVKAIVSKYKKGDFDGTEDIYNYSRCPFPELYGGALYVFAQRRMSPEFKAEIAFELGVDVPDVPGADLETRQMIRRAANDRPRLPETPKPAPTVEPTGDVPTVEGAEVRRNEERDGVEIHFKAKPPEETRDALKADGWRWSRFSKCWYQRDSEEARLSAATVLAAATA